MTDKIQYAVSQAVSTDGSKYGWQLLPFPKENMLFLNVPTAESSTQQQYVMNTITKAWCNFTGWNAACWELYNDAPYFGGNGYVAKAWDTQADAGTVIMGDALQAFSAYGSPGINKQFTQMRPVLNTNGSPAVTSKINLDFDTSIPTSSVSFVPATYGTWGTSTWDNAIWGESLSIQKVWQGANGIGKWAAPHLVASSSGISVQWVSTDVIWRPGGLL